MRKKIEDQAHKELKEIVNDLFGEIVETKSNKLIELLQNKEDELNIKIARKPSKEDVEKKVDEKIEHIPPNLKNIPTIIGIFEDKSTTIAKLLENMSNDFASNEKIDGLKTELNSLIEQKAKDLKKTLVPKNKNIDTDIYSKIDKIFDILSSYKLDDIIKRNNILQVLMIILFLFQFSISFYIFQN